jgi:hypothetical protein
MVVQRLVILGCVESSAGSGVTAKENFALSDVPFDTEFDLTEEVAGRAFDAIVDGGKDVAVEGVEIFDMLGGAATEFAAGGPELDALSAACFAEAHIFFDKTVLGCVILFIKDLRKDFWTSLTDTTLDMSV